MAGGDPHVPHLALRRVALAAPYIVPPGLQAALLEVPLPPERASRPSRERHRRVRPRPNLPAAGAPAVARRRVPGTRAAADGSSSSPPPPAAPFDAFGTAHDGTSSAGSDADTRDMSARVLGLIDLYKDRMVRELAAVWTGETRTMLDGGMLLRVACVAGGAAVAFSEGERAYVTWCTSVHGAVIYLCTCGGHGGAESIEVRSFVGTSSTCSHARALKASFDELALAVGVADDLGLIDAYPVLNNAAVEPSNECAVYLATKTATKMAVFAVLDQGAWAAVTVRRRLGKKSRSNKRTQLRAACTQVSCAKHHWWCPHASAASRWSTELRVAATLADGMGGNALPDGLHDVLLPARAASMAPLSPSQQGAADAAFSDETRWRNSANLLPCEGEVDDCLLFDTLAAAGRSGGSPSFQPEVLCEVHCFACGAAYNGVGVKNTGAVLHTLRGRISVALRQWVCSCGKEVPYDKAHEALFASTSKTVFTRTFMDVMSQMVFTGTVRSRRPPRFSVFFWRPPTRSPEHPLAWPARRSSRRLIGTRVPSSCRQSSSAATSARCSATGRMSPSLLTGRCSLSFAISRSRSSA